MQTQLHIGETVRVTLVAVDVDGNIVGDAIMNSVNFSNSDEGVAVSTIDETSCTLDPVKTAAGKSTTVSYSASIDSADGPMTFTGEVEVDVVSGAVAGVQAVLTFVPKAAADPGTGGTTTGTGGDAGAGAAQQAAARTAATAAKK